MKPVPLPDLIRAASHRVIAHSDELTALDQAIGDGDHGLNMKRGFEAVLAELDQIGNAEDTAVLAAVGKTLVMKVGGASGPLYGTLFLQLGKSWPSSLDAASVHACFESAAQAVAARGKSQVGQKTMLDVLFPVVALIATSTSCRTIRGEAARAAQATIPMEAIRGRASFLKERSMGHMDPGARSSQLMIEAVCDELEKHE